MAPWFADRIRETRPGADRDTPASAPLHARGGSGGADAWPCYLFASVLLACRSLRRPVRPVNIHGHLPTPAPPNPVRKFPAAFLAQFYLQSLVSSFVPFHPHAFGAYRIPRI